MCSDCAFWYMDLCPGGDTTGDCDSHESYDDWDDLDECVLSMRDASDDTQVNSRFEKNFFTDYTKSKFKLSNKSFCLSESRIKPKVNAL